MTIKTGIFDIQIDTDCVRDPGTIELEAFAVTDDGQHTSTDQQTSYAFLRIQAHGYEESTYIESTQAREIAALPGHVRAAYEGLVAIATEAQKAAVTPAAIG